jgi:hypothetical protein
MVTARRRFAASGVGVGLIVGLVLIGLGAESAKAPVPGREAGPLARPTSVLTTDPLLSGVLVSLGAAEEAAPYQLYRPNDSLANDSMIKYVWMEASDPYGVRVAIQYSSNIQVILAVESLGDPQESPGSGNEHKPDVNRSFDELAAQMASEAAAENGDPISDWLAEVKTGNAYLVKYSPDENPGSIMFSYQGVRVTIYGDIDSDTLVGLANSVD